MTLPHCNPDGHLPAGVHRATLDEVGARFAITPRRQEQMEALRRAVKALASVPGVKRVYIVGCYASSREPTQDVDLLVILDPPSVPAKDLYTVARMIEVRKSLRPTVDVSWAPETGRGAQILLQCFQRDKLEHGGGVKGIIELAELA